MNPIKKVFIVIIINCLNFNASFSQGEHSSVSKNNFNTRFLEHLIKIKIDSVRNFHNCNTLINDSILYIASKHHSDYMSENKQLTHFENNETRTPQQRANFYGAKNYLVGENILKTPYGTILKNKKGKLRSTNTYGALAHSIVEGWVNSPGHFKNIITPPFNVTGVSVSIDTNTNIVYACQKFAQKLYQYSFIESKMMFPYSEYKTIPMVINFDNIDKNLINHKHDWQVKHSNPETCEKCLQIIDNKPPITLKIEREKFILRIENSDYVKELIKNRNDGFTVEIVELNDYICGNPLYYTKPSRRNGQCQLNGKILKPLYRKELFFGYKKRKVNKEIKFLSYIFNEKSVPFFKRFYAYKLDKFNTEYFEITLGKVPKDIMGVWGYNLVYLQKKEICHIDYFTNYCGEMYSDSVKMDFLPLDTNSIYKFPLDTVSYYFEIPFQKNKSTFTTEDIEPFIKTLSNQSFTVDSIFIKSSSSIEGDSISNSKLQLKRAESIISVIQNYQSKPIKTKIETYTDWNHFYKKIKLYPELNYLSKLLKKDVLKVVNKNNSSSLEYIFKEERKARIKIYCTIDTTDNNLEYLILKDYNSYVDSLHKKNIIYSKIRHNIIALNKLYKFTYKQVKENKIDSNIFSKLVVPDYYNSSIDLCENFIQYGYQYPTVFNQNRSWVDNKNKIEKAILEDDLNTVSLAFLYTFCKIKTELLMKTKNPAILDIQLIFQYLEQLKPLYESSTLAANNINKINFNLNMLLLNKIFISNPSEYSSEALKSLYIIHSYYTSTKTLTDSIALKIAMLGVFYNNTPFSLSILKPYYDKDYIIAYSLPLSYIHSSSIGSQKFYDEIVFQSNKLSEATWCNLFMNNCTIPFQSFDYEKLRTLFCEKCMSKNEYLIELMK